ncbi:MAG: hypothetical protein INQ03_05435 [Candidatus Heimdallarchaeota archaeon]|nr:hypothetical protein [Candidatus Heimdallarchaeota archaeon]
MPNMLVVPLSEIDNYIIGKTELKWGVRERNKELRAVRPGDELLFIIGVHTHTEPVPKGFPRLKSYEGLDVQIEEMWKVKVKSKVKRDKEEIFGEDFPYSFEFEILDSMHDFSLDTLHKDLQEGIRKLFTGRKKFHHITSKLFDQPRL